MKVTEFIRKLLEIGYDENTELTFSCTDDETGEYYVIPFEEITKSAIKMQIKTECDVFNRQFEFSISWRNKWTKFGMKKS